MMAAVQAVFPAYAGVFLGECRLTRRDARRQCRRRREGRCTPDGNIADTRDSRLEAPRQDPSVHYPGIEKEPSADSRGRHVAVRTARRFNPRPAEAGATAA